MYSGIKKICILLTAVIISSMIWGGCASTPATSNNNSAAPDAPGAAAEPVANEPDSTAPDTSEHVNLVMYLVGDSGTDLGIVYDEVNKKLKEDINATVDVNFIPWSDTDQKYSLLFASGEDFDVIFTATWMKYAQEATRGGFLELTDDLLGRTFTRTMGDIPQEAWEQTKISGKTYMIPSAHMAYDDYFLALVRGDLREKYNIPEIDSLDKLYQYWDAIAQNEKDIFALNASDLHVGLREALAYYSANLWEVGGLGSTLGFYFDITSDSPKVEWVYLTDTYKDYTKKAVELNQAGVWPKNAYANKIMESESFRNGKSATFFWNIGTLENTYQMVMQEHPEWKPEFADINTGAKKLASLYTNNGIGIRATSKNPERALMMMDLFMGDKSYQDLTRLGIEGVHWEPVGDDKFKILPDGGKYPAGGSCPWGWGNDKYIRVNESIAPKHVELEARWIAEDTVFPKAQLFTFNDENVKNELAALTNVITQYAMPLDLGSVDPDEGLKTLEEKAKQAGLDKIIQEMQSQMDAAINS